MAKYLDDDNNLRDSDTHETNGDHYNPTTGGTYDRDGNEIDERTDVHYNSFVGKCYDKDGNEVE